MNHEAKTPAEISSSDFNQARAMAELDQPTPAMEAVSAEVKRQQSMAERHPDWPEIKANFYFSPHGAAKDFAGLPEVVRDADVYIYENSSDVGTKFLQEVADTDIASLDDPAEHLNQFIQKVRVNGEPITGTYTETILRTIYGTRKVILGIDVPGEDREALIAHIEQPVETHQTLDETLAHYKTNLIHNAYLQKQREEHMMTQFEKQMQQLLKDRPDLAVKPQLNVAFSIGGFHTSLQDKFNDAGVETAATFSDPSYKPAFGFEVMHSLEAGQEPEPETVAKAYAEYLLHEALALNGLTGDVKDDTPYSTDELFRYTRTMAESMSMREIQALHEGMRDGKLTIQAFNEILEKNDQAPLPKTAEDLKERLAAAA